MQEKEKKIPKITTLNSRIKKALKDQGTYFPGMDFMIELTAGNMHAYYLILRDVEKLTTTDIIEKTREGNDKKQTEPSLKSLREQSEMVRKCLRELRLTLATVEGVGDDEFEDLIDKVNNVE